jgi:hypothetical protein
MFITYVVLDPRKPGSFPHPFGVFDHQPAYVGKGRPNRPLDIVTFLEGDLQSYSGRLIDNWLKGMRDKGYRKLDVVTVYEGDEVTAFATERILTKHFGIKPEGGVLMNSRHGGDDGWSMSSDTKCLLSELNRGENNPNFGKTWSDERRKKWMTSWKKKDRKRSRESMARTWAGKNRKYEIISVTGETFSVDDLTKFCAENKLPLSALRSALKTEDGIVRGIRRPSRVDGWSIKYST